MSYKNFSKLVLGITCVLVKVIIILFKIIKIHNHHATIHLLCLPNAYILATIHGLPCLLEELVQKVLKDYNLLKITAIGATEKRHFLHENDTQYFQYIYEGKGIFKGKYPSEQSIAKGRRD
ncbi:hypothetical protein GIB67_013162 [Kingdonia uniflora]|uniref:Uncharacterized protein n=1 Tax=Kingdonia uniflora TaxID=39325 RepID=A0A7J7LCP6_9MAGN|nr:hypothetical protein GIB67_013162 [Kingdonia uniflora]